MNPLISSSKFKDSHYFYELEALCRTASIGTDTKNRIKNIFEWHSDSLIADLIANPQHRKTYRAIGAEFRKNEVLKPFQSTIGSIQKIARLLEIEDIPGLEKLSSQIKDVKILQKFSHLSIISDLKEIRKIPHPSIRALVFSALINRHHVPIKDLNLTKNELMDIGPHLTFLDCKDAFNDSWKASDIYAFLDVCVNLKILKINSPIITRLPLLLHCEELDHYGCINLDPESAIYEEICDTIGGDFFEKLKKGNLYKKKFYEKLGKSEGRPVTIHLESLKSSSLKESIEKAKAVIGDVYQEIKFFKSETLEINAGRAELSKAQKNNVFFEFIKKAVELGKINVNFFIKNVDSFDQNERFQMAKFFASNKSISFKQLSELHLNNSENLEIVKILIKSGVEIDHYIEKFNFIEEQYFEVAKLLIETRQLDSYFHIKNLLTEGYRQLVDQIFELEIPVIIKEKALEIYDDKKIPELITLLQDYQKTSPEEALLQFPGLKLLLANKTLSKNEIEEFAKTNLYYKEVKFIVEKICTQNDEHIRNTLVTSLGVFLLACQLQDIPPENLEKIKPVIEEFFDFRDPNFRLRLLPHVIKTMQTRERIESFAKMFNLTENKSFTSLISMLVAPYASEEDKAKLAKVVKLRAHFQNNNLRNPFIKNLEQIVSENSLNDSEKKDILDQLIFSESLTPLSLMKNAEKVSTLIGFGKSDAIKGASSIRELDLIVDMILNEELGLQSIENSSEKFMDTFGSFPKPTLVFQYAANLKKLPDSEREAHMECLKDFVKSVLEGDFHEIRYETDKNAHLQALFSTSEGKVVKEEWMKGARYEDAFGQALNISPSENRKPSKYEGFVITDTDDPYHLLSLGEIDGSCQKVTMDVSSSKSLLSSILDGKNRALIVQDRQGKVIARCMLRLLWDAKDNRIVLFQERIYPKTVQPDSAIDRAIINSCKRRAADLNLPLLSATKTSLPYKNEVFSIGGRTPSEYIDANGIGKTGNVWSLKHLYQVPWKTPN